MESMVTISLLVSELGIMIAMLIYYRLYDKPHKFKKKDKIKPLC